MTAVDEVASFVTRVLVDAGSRHNLLAEMHGDAFICRQLYILLSAEKVGGA